MKTSRIVLGLLLAVATAVASAQVYKWKDADGKIHYSDVPPMPGQAKAEVVKTNDMPVSSVSTGSKAPPITPKNASQPTAVASAPQASAVAQKDPKVCQQAKARKSFLESGKITRTVNDKGEVEFLSDEKRQSEIADANKAIKTFCP